MRWRCAPERQTALVDDSSLPLLGSVCTEHANLMHLRVLHTGAANDLSSGHASISKDLLCFIRMRATHNLQFRWKIFISSSMVANPCSLSLRSMGLFGQAVLSGRQDSAPGGPANHGVRGSTSRGLLLQWFAPFRDFTVISL